MDAASGMRVAAIGLCMAAAAGPAPASPNPDSVRTAVVMARHCSAAGLGVAPLSGSVRAVRGRPTVVHFRVAAAAPFPRTAVVTVRQPGSVEVIDAGQVPANQKHGCAIIEARSAGVSTIEIAGAPIDVVSIDAASDVADDLRIITPTPGAALWGQVTIGATWWRPDQPEGAVPRLRVLSADGNELAAIDTPNWNSTLAQGPTGLAAFTLDADALPAGDVQVCIGWPGSPDVQRLTARVVRAEPERLFSGECEAEYDLPPLPEERREPKPNIGKHAKASDGRFFNNAGAVPRFRVPVVVSESAGAGWYQVIATAAGDMAAATLPAVGVTIDEAQYPETRASIAMPGFHRVAIGLPVRLQTGSHVLRLDFLNDFYAAPGVDRNLRLDKVEIVRVADAAAGPAKAGGDGGEMMMMAAAPSDGDAMMAMSGASASASGENAWPASAAARARRTMPPVITFARGWDDTCVAGDLDVRAAAWWPGIADLEARKARSDPGPSVTLTVDGRPLPRQFSAAPRFWVPGASLNSGEHRLQFTLDTHDGSVQSPEVRVRAGGRAIAGGPIDDRPFYRFTVHDPRWSALAGSIVTADQNPPERACFGLFSSGDITLALPGGLEGEYEVELEARGTSFNGPAELAVRLERPGAPSETLGIMALGGGWEPVTVLTGAPAERNRTPAVVRFEPGQGPTTLMLSFINDLYEPEKGDRNAFVQAVALRPRIKAAAEAETLGGSIVWPTDGEVLRAGAAAAIVLMPEGGLAPRTAEVIINGERTGQIIDLRGKMGPLVVPVSLRGVAAGEHDLSLRIEASSNRSLTLAARRVRLIEAADASPTAYERAVTLLNRIALGPDERELAAVLTMGQEAYLDQRLAAPASDPGVARAHALAAIRYSNSSSGGDVQRRAIHEALITENPVRYRFVLFIQNHFSTWIRKTEARRKADEHREFCRLGVAPFADLLTASAMSPAMLRYLDQEQSFARRLNENYAREIMELHTLGVHGGYTQDDVTTLARMLTGWTTAREPFVAATSNASFGVGPDEYGMREVFRYDPALADDQTRVFLGRTFTSPEPVHRHQRVLAAINLLAGHPSTARYVSSKLAAHLTAYPAPDALIDRLASAFERTGGDMREVVRALATDEDLYRGPPRLAHPPIFAFRLARCLGSADANAVHDFLNLAGHGMFDRSTPDGYPESDAEVTDSNAMLQRWKFARRLENALLEAVPSARRSGDKPITDAEAQATIDLLAMRLTGQLLGEASNAAAMEILHATEGKRDERWRAVGVFVASAPEAQLR